jgi:hypothetical protein
MQSEIEVIRSFSLNKSLSMLTATHKHALLRTKGKELANLERKHYSKYVLKFNIHTLFYVLEFDIRTLLNVLIVRISNLST